MKNLTRQTRQSWETKRGEERKRWRWKKERKEWGQWELRSSWVMSWKKVWDWVDQFEFSSQKEKNRSGEESWVSEIETVTEWQVCVFYAPRDWRDLEVEYVGSMVLVRLMIGDLGAGFVNVSANMSKVLIRTTLIFFCLTSCRRPFVLRSICRVLGLERNFFNLSSKPLLLM